MTVPFALALHPAPTDPAPRAERLADPGFGTVFSDHMARVDWREGEGWVNPRIEPRGPLALDPAAAVLHYAQEIFEGLKAYRQPDGSLATFRPAMNAARFRRSAAGIAMPELPDDLFIGAIEALVRADRDWYPSCDGGSLYIRPFMIATEAFLGVRPAREYAFLVLLSPVGRYWKSATAAVSVYIERDRVRAARGGTGTAKCGGNYAASLVPQRHATEHGCDQVLFLDADEHRFVEELGGMNLMTVGADGTLTTPPLGGTILDGVTRDSLLALARADGRPVREAPIAIDDLLAGIADGSIAEVFACGTAAVVTPIARLVDDRGEHIVGDGAPGPMTLALRERLTAIQTGAAPDPFGWRHPLL